MNILISSLIDIGKTTGIPIQHILWIYYVYTGVKDIPIGLEPMMCNKYIIDIGSKLLNNKECKELFSGYEVKIDKDSVPVSDNIFPIENWIQKYRELFKGHCGLATPMGTKEKVITNMKWFIKKYGEDNPEYMDIGFILEATKLGIATIELKYKSKGFGDVPQADNFIVKDDYRTPGGFPLTNKVYVPSKEYLINFCEILADLKAEGKEVKVSNIKPNYIKSI